MHVEPSILSIQLPFVWLHAEAHNEVSPMVNLFNFIVAFGALWFLFVKFNVFGFIGKQQEQIRKEIEAVEAEKQKALDALERVKKQTQNLEHEVDQILKAAKTSADGLSLQIIENAKLEAAKIIENSKKRVEQEQRSAMKALESRLLNDALQEARETLTHSLTSQDRERSVDAFLSELDHVPLLK